MILRDFLDTPMAIHAEHLRLRFRSANCEQCNPAPVSWHDRARAGQLPTLIVGGTPRPDSLERAEPSAPLRARSALGRPGALPPAA